MNLASGASTLDVMEGAHRYNRWIYDRVRDGLGQRVLEIGCGTGTITSFMVERQLVVGIDVVGFEGELTWDKTKPDGTPRKLLDVSKLRGLGWTPTIKLRDGIAQTYDWFLKNVAK